MSVWDELKKPVDKVLDSNAFKAVMPVQAIGQEAVKLGSGAAGINNGRGLSPADQYAAGAAGGAAIAGAGALMGGAGAAQPSPAGQAPAPTPSSWENSAQQERSATQRPVPYKNIYEDQGQQQIPLPPYPTIRPSA